MEVLVLVMDSVPASHSAEWELWLIFAYHERLRESSVSYVDLSRETVSVATAMVMFLIK